MISKCIRRLSFRSLATEDANTKFEKDGNNNCSSYNKTSQVDSHYLPAPRAVKPWTSSSWERPSTTPITPTRPTLPVLCRNRTSDLMHCTVYLVQQTPASHVLSVVLHGAVEGGAGAEGGVRRLHGDVVASSAVPRNIQHAGCLSIELQCQGERYTACEPAWRGHDVEKQFILHHKRAEGGILGKVVVSHRGASADSTLFELYVTSPVRHTPPPPAEDMSWGAAGFKELAAILELLDEQNDVLQLAKDLGFTERELRAAGAGTAHDDSAFSSLLTTYAARGGTPQELLRAMYTCRRGRGLATVGSPLSPRHRMLSHCSSLSDFENDPDLDGLEEAAVLSPVTTRKRKFQQTHSTPQNGKRSRVSSPHSTAEYDADFCDAATLPVGDLDCGGFEQAAFPPSPPATPLKRLSATSSHNEPTSAFSYR